MTHKNNRKVYKGKGCRAEDLVGAWFKETGYKWWIQFGGSKGYLHEVLIGCEFHKCISLTEEQWRKGFTLILNPETEHIELENV